jgi:hypothetical protein
VTPPGQSRKIDLPQAPLEDSRLLVKEPDLFRQGRATYRIAEPLITFYQAIMSRDWARLELGDGATIWRSAQPRFLSQIVGGHFETICRDFAGDSPFRGILAAHELSEFRDHGPSHGAAGTTRTQRAHGLRPDGTSIHRGPFAANKRRA